MDFYELSKAIRDAAWFEEPEDHRDVCCWVDSTQEAEEIRAIAKAWGFMVHVEDYNDGFRLLVNIATDKWVYDYHRAGGQWGFS